MKNSKKLLEIKEKTNLVKKNYKKKSMIFVMNFAKNLSKKSDFLL